ncbi:MAG: four helix bundle protein [Bacteroidota bacterium]
MRENILKDKSFGFAIRIIELFKYLKVNQQEYVLSKQILRSGTAIGASIREAEFAESSKGFIHKLSISLKEANETKYWLELLFAGNFIEEKLFQSFIFDCDEILKILVSSINTSKKKLS